MKWATANQSKSYSVSEEGDAVHLVGLEEHYVLKASFTKSESVEFCSQFDWLKGSNQWKASRIDQVEGCCFPSEQHQALSNWLKWFSCAGCPTTPTILTWLTLHLQMTTKSS